MIVITCNGDPDHRHYFPIFALLKREKYPPNYATSKAEAGRAIVSCTESSMKHEYDLFERFPDGSSLWRDCALGLETARLRLQELTQRSENEFYAIDLTNGERLVFESKRDVHGFRAPSRAERRSKTQAA